MANQSGKPYPSTFNELIEQFNTLDENNTETFGDQSEYDNNPYYGCQKIEYPIEPGYYGVERFVVFKYKGNYYQPSFEGSEITNDNHQIIGRMTKEVFEEWEEDIDVENNAMGDWLVVDTDSLEDGNYTFTMPSFDQLIEDEENVLRRRMVRLNEEDSKVVLEGLYWLDRRLLDEEGFRIDSFYG